MWIDLQPQILEDFASYCCHDSNAIAYQSTLMARYVARQRCRLDDLRGRNEVVRASVVGLRCVSCERCGKNIDLLALNPRANWRKVRFCSNLCRKNASGVRGRRLRREQAGQRECAHCGTPFALADSRNYAWQVYCSSKCRMRAEWARRSRRLMVERGTTGAPTAALREMADTAGLARRREGRAA